MTSLGGHVRALPQLEHRLLGGRPVPAGADDGHTPPVAALERIQERLLDGEPQPARVFATQGIERGDRARVAGGVAVALLDLGGDDEHLVGDLGQRALGLPGDKPDGTVEGLGRLDREPCGPLVADADKQVGLGRRENRLKRLQCLAAGLGRVERGPAAREDELAVGQATIPDALGDAAQPRGLVVDRLTGKLTGHRERDGTIRAMEGFRFVCPQDVTFRDLDTFGHVNNAVYLTYIENARIGYLREVLGIDSLEDLLVIVAKVHIDFRSRATLGETLDVGSRVSRIGTKSFDMDHEIHGPDVRLVARAETTLVTFDYRGDSTMPVPDLWRDRIETYEARDFAAA
jgi:acyl-CoA thioester hydrolase